MIIFDRSRYAQHQDRAASQFKKADFLIDRITLDLQDRLKDIKRDFPSVLICGTRFDKKIIDFLCAEKGVTHIDIIGVSVAQIDILKHVLKDVSAAQIDFKLMPIDQELLPVQSHSYDLVIEAGQLHNVNDVTGMLIQSRLALKADGLFMGVMAGGDSLHQLRASLIAAETENYGGACARVSPFVPLQNVAGLMQRAGFSLPVVDHDVMVVDYRALTTLMHDLRALGETACLSQAVLPTRSMAFFEATEAYYKKQYGRDDGTLPADFELIYLHGWAPHESQQKPLRPGSAKTSLTEVL